MADNLKKSEEKKSVPTVLGGAMIIAGTAIGAGMLANPTGTSGIWFIGSIIVLFYTWFCMLFSGLMILEVNLHFPLGSSFNTIVKNLLGKEWNLIVGITLSFTLFCLTYAYITVGGEIVRNVMDTFSRRFLDDSLHLSRIASSIIFTITLAFCVWLSKKAVDRLSFIFVLTMAVTFLLAISGMLEHVSAKVLFNLIPGEKPIYWKYIWIAFPLCLTAFAYQGSVPSMVIYFKKNGKKVAKSLLWGTLITFIIYILWQLSVHGNLPRHKFKPVVDSNGDVIVLLRELSSYVGSSNIHLGNITLSLTKLIDVFAFVAIISSFLGCTMGLFDYVADLFHFKTTKVGRLKSASVTYLPPLLACILFPAGFVRLIGLAGFLSSFWAVLVPAILLIACRRKFQTSSYKVPGGNFIIFFILLFAGVNIVSQIFIWLGIFPLFKG